MHNSELISLVDLLIANKEKLSASNRIAVYKLAPIAKIYSQANKEYKNLCKETMLQTNYQEFCDDYFNLNKHTVNRVSLIKSLLSKTIGLDIIETKRKGNEGRFYSIDTELLLFLQNIARRDKNKDIETLLDNVNSYDSLDAIQAIQASKRARVEHLDLKQELLDIEASIKGCLDAISLIISIGQAELFNTG